MYVWRGLERICPDMETTPMPILFAEDSNPRANGPGGRLLAGDDDEAMAAAARR